MSNPFESTFSKGQNMRDLLGKLGGVSAAGRPVTVQVEERGVPYLTDTLVAWTDGPPSSVVAWVLSAGDPDGHHWRRWTISKVGPWKYELGCFPTPFNNPRDPLSPGVPPTSSRVG